MKRRRRDQRIEVICVDCKKKFKTVSRKTVRCPTHRAIHNAEVSRQWHQANYQRYAYRPEARRARLASLQNLPTVGDRYAFYWELES